MKQLGPWCAIFSVFIFQKQAQRQMEEINTAEAEPFPGADADFNAAS